ncbi:hypothetical protein [Candidatus Pantoea persica]|uniref:hypothetical protein n=1 Tax=Candidatus Pantoea persica TaxID=2518128 RepID=UPI00215D63E1|nr:hypothetical protein [Candidatus Pantoea persica]MBA2817030.1 hypothetical protein [Candidatus Pantoea persica]
MAIQMHDGWYIFTASVLNRSRQFVSFSEGIAWVFVQKLAAACAAEMRQPLCRNLMHPKG